MGSNNFESSNSISVDMHFSTDFIFIKAVEELGTLYSCYIVPNPSTTLIFILSNL